MVGLYRLLWQSVERDLYKQRETSLSRLAGRGIQWQRLLGFSKCIHMVPENLTPSWALDPGGRLDFDQAGQP